MASFFSTGIVLEPHQVIRRPLVTEKGTHLSEKQNAYSFEVHPLATKSDIKRLFSSCGMLGLLLFGRRLALVNLGVTRWLLV
jgi:hypothetical protein